MANPNIAFSIFFFILGIICVFFTKRLIAKNINSPFAKAISKSKSGKKYLAFYTKIMPFVLKIAGIIMIFIAVILLL